MCLRIHVCVSVCTRFLLHLNPLTDVRRPGLGERRRKTSTWERRVRDLLKFGRSMSSLLPRKEKRGGEGERGKKGKGGR